MNILGIEINNLSREEIIDRVKFFLDDPQFHQIATINPEFLLEAEENNAFRSTLQICDLRIADGFGITLAFLLKGTQLKCRFPGVDLMEKILFIANEKHLKVYLAIRKNGLSSFQEVKDALSKKYPNILINGADIDVLSHHLSLITYPASVVLCNFGAPSQEIFLASLKNTSSNIRLAVGIGGSFDYLTGKMTRAPQCMRLVGLEWLWRLIQQPKRFKRIWNAVILFPFRVILSIIRP